MEIERAAGQPELHEARVWKVAKVFANTSGFVPNGLQGKTAEVWGILLAGEALGLEWPEALRSVHWIAGRVVYSAELQRSLILRAGHRLDIEVMEDDLVTLRGTRADGSTLALSWDMDRARKAGLLTRGNDTWVKYPRAMLLARATSELGRALFPDCLSGLASFNEYEQSDIAELPYPAVPDEPRPAINNQGMPAEGEDEIEDAELVTEDDEADAAWVEKAQGAEPDAQP